MQTDPAETSLRSLTHSMQSGTREWKEERGRKKLEECTSQGKKKMPRRHGRKMTRLRFLF